MNTRKEKWIAYTIGIIMLMELIDASALNTSLPQMATSFNVSPINLKVAITVYLLTLGLFIPTSSWVAEKIGVKKTLLCSVSGFVVASVLCGLSQSLAMLIVMRAFQGVFGAFTMPVARLALIRIFKKNLLYAMSIIGAIVTVGPMIGPLLGGAITTYLNWRFIFFINLPIGLLMLIPIAYLLPVLNDRKTKLKPFDLKGFFILGTSIVLLMLFLDTLIDPNIRGFIKGINISIAIVLILLYLHHARSRRHKAIIDLQIFKNRMFSYLIITSIILRLSTMGIMFLFPLYLQTQQGFTPFGSGLTFLAFIIPAWLIKRFVKSILNRISFYTFYLIITLGMMLCYLVCAWLFSDFYLLPYLLIQSILGLLFGSYTMISNAAIYTRVTDEQTGEASVIMSTVIQLSGAFAVAWVAVLLGFVSGIKDMSHNTAIPAHAFSVVTLVCAIGMLMAFISLFRAPKRELASLNLN